MEYGFFHPDFGYWQAVSEVPDFIRETYPKGTVAVPLKPGRDFKYDGTQWIEVAPPAPSAEEIRSDRDALLAKSDWTQLPDAQSAMSTELKAAWATYRQALRDVPQQEGFTANVLWPSKPQ